MVIDEKKNVCDIKSQQIVLNDRKKLKITGVSEVDNFSETVVCANTCMGQMRVSGESLKISKLDIDAGELVIDGQINSMEYTKKREKTGFFESIFK